MGASGIEVRAEARAAGWGCDSRGRELPRTARPSIVVACRLPTPPTAAQRTPAAVTLLTCELQQEEGVQQQGAAHPGPWARCHACSVQLVVVVLLLMLLLLPSAVLHRPPGDWKRIH